MAMIRCPRCGRENPDSLTVCQFCQTPLNSEGTLRIGDKPTKKNTGELEPVLPDWLKEVRQQAKDSAEKDAAEKATMPKIQKAEPPDLLAGLASQSANAGEEEVPDWLASLRPKPAETPPAPARQESDFFAQFNNEPAAPKSESRPQQQPPQVPFTPEQPAASSERDELSEWLAQASEQPSEPFSLESDSADMGWDFKEQTFPAPSQEKAPQPEEDLSWLRDLEAEAKKTGELARPKSEEDQSSGFGMPGGSVPSGQDDLSWLDHLGALPATEPSKAQPAGPGEDLSWLNTFDEKAPSPPASTPPASQNDLSWLDDLGSLPYGEEPASQTAGPKDDLSWLNAFADAPSPNEPNPATQDELSWMEELDKKSEPSQPSEPKPAPPSSGEDLSWLRDLQGTPGSFSAGLTDSSESKLSQPSSDEEDLGWLRDLQGVPGSLAAGLAAASTEQKLGETAEPGEPSDSTQLSPRQTAPLGDASDSSIPDWLKSAAEEPSLPLGPQAFDQIRKDKPGPSLSEEAALSALFGAAMKSKEKASEPSQPEVPVADAGGSASTEGSAPFFSEDVNSIFSQDLPAWLANPDTEADRKSEDIGIHAEGGEPLSPAELPTWVQAMRPVEAVISEAGPGLGDQPVEREGPLAGLKGVIPIAAIGSLRRPQPIPLTLQASKEEQASAAILEQILVGETTPRSLVSTPVMGSQRNLRWSIAGLILIVLMAVIFSGTQIMPVSPVLPVAAGNVNNTVMNIADNAPVLVILDYEPGLSGEMEAVSGPVLDQLVQLHHPYLSFLATSSSGNALVERLLRNISITRPDGTGYIEGQDYTNMGYLPGGEAAIAAFLQSPQSAIPSSPVLNLSEYAAVLLLTDHADSARTWVEQLSTMKQSDPTLASQPLLAISSAQTGPMLQPYFDSKQVTGLISGLPIAARYEFLNGNRPGMARSYWDAFGVGIMVAILSIVIGSLWSAYAGYRDRHPQAAKE